MVGRGQQPSAPPGPAQGLLEGLQVGPSELEDFSDVKSALRHVEVQRTAQAMAMNEVKAQLHEQRLAMTDLTRQVTSLVSLMKASPLTA